VPFWSTLGIHVTAPPLTHWLWTGFWSADECARLRAAMDGGAADPAEILEDSVEHQDHVRRTLSIDPGPDMVAQVERTLEDARSRLESMSGLMLGPREGSGFLRYLPGGFYRPHQDRGDVPSWPGAAHRQLSIVVFLSTARDAGDPESFTGGVLRLYPDGGDPIDIVPVEGTLVAFSATMLHEVTRVGEAVRDAVVDWFY